MQRKDDQTSSEDEEGREDKGGLNNSESYQPSSESEEEDGFEEGSLYYKPGIAKKYTLLYFWDQTTDKDNKATARPWTN